MRPRCLAMLLSLFYTVNIVDLSKLFYWLDSPGSGSFIGWNLSVDWLMWGPWVPHANRRHPFTHAKSFPRQSVARSRPPELAEGRPERPLVYNLIVGQIATIERLEPFASLTCCPCVNRL